MIILEGLFCPQCGGPTLGVSGNHIQCTNINCELPEAAERILSDRETEHVVVMEPSSWSMKHPLRERLDDELLTCYVGSHIAEFYEMYMSGQMDGTPVEPATYRVTVDGVGEDATLDWEML